MKVFITGVAGFLGSHIADAMLADGHEVVGIDNFIGGDPENILHNQQTHRIERPKLFTFYHGDCNDFEYVRAAMKGCDTVFHCAATAYEGLSVFSPHIVTQNIVTAATGVFSAAMANRVKRIVHCSSMARYGAIDTPYRESQVCMPQDPYGIGKLCAEKMLENLCSTHRVDYVIAVPHNIIGPRQKYDDPFRNVASIMINRMVQGKQPIIYGDGRQMRCFSYVDDCISCFKAMAYDDNALGQVVNIGPDEEPVSINDLASLLAELLHFPLDPIYMPGRPQEVKLAVCSSRKARMLLGYETKTTLEEGLRKMIEPIKRNPKPFEYHLPIEIVSDRTPKTWTDRLF